MNILESSLDQQFNDEKSTLYAASNSKKKVKKNRIGFHSQIKSKVNDDESQVSKNSSDSGESPDQQ